MDRVLEKYPDVRKYLEKNLLPFPADWPGWYCPKKLLANNCSGKYSAMIPEQGQFHVALNAIEDTVLIFKHFFDKLFFSLFGSTLPKKPRHNEPDVLSNQKTDLGSRGDLELLVYDLHRISSGL